MRPSLSLAHPRVACFAHFLFLLKRNSVFAEKDEPCVVVASSTLTDATHPPIPLIFRIDTR